MQAAERPKAEDRPHHRDVAQAVRLLGSLIAGASALALLLAPAASGAVILQRALLAALGGVVAVAASERRSRVALNALALMALLAVAAHAVELEPVSLWRVGAIVTGVLLTGALFLQWPWSWQLALSIPLVSATIMAAWRLASRGLDADGQFVPVALTVAAAGVISVVGARLLWLGRERLAASERRYRRLFEDSRSGRVLVDASGTIQDLNPSFASLLGKPPSDLRASALAQHLAPVQPDGRDHEHFVRERLAMAINGQPQETIAYLQTAKGVSVEVELSFWRVETAESPLVEIVARDLSAHRRLERQEERRRRLDALGRVLGNMAEEFGSLFEEISARGEALMLEAVGDRDRNLAGQIVTTAAEGARLSRELIRFSRQERLTIGRVDTGRFVSQIETLARAVLPADITVEVKLEENLPDLAGDGDHLSHAALQLLLNAREAMPDGGKLTISAGAVRLQQGSAIWPGASPGQYVRLSVTDTGSGMDPAVLERVFEPFFSAAPLYQARATGFPVVYGILRAHQGSVRIDSVPDQGTSVHLLVPAWEGVVTGEAKEGVTPRAQRASVLIVDPDELVRSSARRALTQMGYRVLEAPDADSATTQCRAADPPVDVVILGGAIPDGVHRAFKELKSLKPDLAVVVGLDSAEIVGADSGATVRSLLADGFVSRPYERDQLATVLARVLGESY